MCAGGFYDNRLKMATCVTFQSCKQMHFVTSDQYIHILKGKPYIQIQLTLANLTSSWFSKDIEIKTSNYIMALK